MKKLLAILSLILLPAFADAATIYVDSGCSAVATYVPATRACSGGSAVVRPTIFNGISAMSSGDILLIRTGTYTQGIGDNPQSPTVPNGTAGNPTTIAAYPGETVTIRPTNRGGLDMSGMSWITIGGNLITGGGIKFDGAATSENGLVVTHCITAQTCIFQNNEVFNGWGQGGFAVNNTIIRKNKFYDNGFRAVAATGDALLYHGLYLQGTGNLVQRNEFYGNTSFGAQDYSSLGNNANNVWEYNIFHDNAAAGQGGGLIVYGTNNIVRFNLAYSNPGSGGIGLGDCLNCFLYNNTAYGNQGAGIGINGRNPTAKNNVGSTTSNYADSSAGHDLHQEPAATGVSMSNNACATSDGLSVSCSVSINPQFTDAANQDFSLLASSPLISGGVNVGLPFNGNFPEIGAFEIATPTSATTLDASNVDVTVGSAFAPFTSSLLACSNFVLKQNAVTKTLTGCSNSGNATFRVTCASCLTAGGGNITIAYTSSAAITDSILIGNSKNQRLLSFGDFPVTNTISGATAVFTAKHFRCRVWNINTTANTAQSWYMPEDSACSVQNSSGKIAIIVAVDCTGADCDATGFKWEYQTNGGGGWTEIDNSCVTNSVCYDNTQIGGAVHGASITPTLLTNPQSTYVTGWVQAQNSSFNSIDLSLNSATNIMGSFAIKNGLAVDTVLAVRPKQDNGVAITHNVTASFTLANAAQGLP